MNYRFYLTIGSSEIEVFPLNFFKTSLVDSREQGQIFYRRKFSGTLRFYNNAKESITDFTLINLVETLILAGSLDCQDLLLRIEQKNSGANTWHTYWEGHFATSDGKFDLDQCTYDITPLPYDDYVNFDINSDKEYNILAGVPTVVTTTILRDGVTYTYTRNRWLIDVIEYIAQQIVPAVTVTSNILNTGYNYVTETANKYNLLTIAHKSDIKRPTATNPANIGMMSWNSLMDILKMMNLYYVYDGTTIRIEHLSYWESAAGLDLRTQSIAEKSNKYSYLKSEMPQFEKFSHMEASDDNFVTGVIEYINLCVDKSTSEYAINVTTDIEYIQDCMADPELIGNISDEGWVVFANYLVGASYYVYFGVGYTGPSLKFNIPLSWSVLLRTFFLHGRPFISGYVNNDAVNFISSRRNKVQSIKAIVCYEDDYDPNDYLTTELGEDYFDGQKGYVKSADIKPTGEVAFELVYGETNTPTPPPVADKIINVVYDQATDPDHVYTYLSEPNVYDTYYWIYWDGTDCQEIMIPAGTVYQEDLEGYSGAGVVLEFYTDDPSLTGWIFTYNTDEPVDLTTSPPCPGVPPVPPAVPAAPVANGVTQLALCDPLIFTWGAVALATFYKVFRKPDSDLLDNWEEQGNELDTTFEDYWAGNQSGVTFYYKVQACNISGCSADSNEVSKNVAC
jgi:hypothetical protein